MSAGGLTYSGLTNYGCVTLPSVEAGLGSMNILRDPPKSIMTRRRDKVGETSSITEICDGSGDRACEAINLYARGVNPSVSVSYSNYGNNGGQRPNSLSRAGGTTQAFLPYTIMKDGAWRPPIITQEQLVPLSRQPRINTQAFTQPGFVDFSKKIMCPGGNYRGVKKKTLKTCIRPTAVFQIETPSVEPFEVRYVIKNPIKIRGDSGFRTRDLTSQTNQEPSKVLNTTALNVDANVNYGSENMVKYSDNSHLNTERYLQDPLHSKVQSNISQNIQITPIEDIMDLDIRTKEARNISYMAPYSSNTKEEHMHADPEFQRRVVMATANTNKQKNIYVRPEIEYQKEYERNRPIAHATANTGSMYRQSGVDNNSRDYSLQPKISAGSFATKARQPMLNRMQNVNENYEPDKLKMARRVFDMQMNRDRR